MAVNADEGEPGTFKDRHYLERDPHRFIEGMLIAAWVVEAPDIYIYMRDEYPEVRLMLARRDRQGRRGRARQAHAGPSAPRRRRLHLRRRIRDDRIDRGQARPAAASPALCGAGRPVRPADARAERRDALLGARHRGEGRGLVHARTAGASARACAASRCRAACKKPGVVLAPAGVTVPRADRGISAAAWPTATTSRAICRAAPRAASCRRPWPTFRSTSARSRNTAASWASHAVVILSDKDDMKAVALNLMRFFEDESCGQCTPCRDGTEKAVKLMATGRGTGAAERPVARDGGRLDLRPGPGGAQPGRCAC